MLAKKTSEFSKGEAAPKKSVSVAQLAKNIEQKAVTPREEVVDTVVDTVHPEVSTPSAEFERMTTEEFRDARAKAVASSPLKDYQDSASSDTFVSLQSVDVVQVKVEHGVAHVVGRINGVLVYIETQVSDTCRPAKVWVLGHVAGAQEKLKLQLEPLMLRVNEYVSPAVARMQEKYAAAKAKVITTTAPLRAKLVDGVLYIQGTVGDTSISIRAKASETWTAAVAQASSSYATVHDTLEVKTRPARVWTSGKYNIARDQVVSIGEPYWIRARDGYMYVQVSVGDTLLRIKVTADDSTQRFSAAVLSACTSMQGRVNSYTKPILAKLISVYDQARTQLLQILGPYLAKAQNMAKYTSTRVNDMAVMVKVRAASIRDRTQEYQSMCYIKFKNGFVYIHGVVGDKVVCVKVRLVDLTSSLRVQAVEFNSKATSHLIAAKGRIQDAPLAAAQFASKQASALKSNVRYAVTDRQTQVTAVAAVGGAATMGATGGATGLTAGAVIGAAIGVVPALFTFGLSIPIGAALGGATGLCAGTVAGSTVGFVSGGVAGRTVHKNKDEISNGMAGACNKAADCKDFVAEKTSNYRHSALSKANGCKDFVAEKTMDYKDFVVSKTVATRARLVGGTGGSD